MLEDCIPYRPTYISLDAVKACRFCPVQSGQGEQLFLSSLELSFLCLNIAFILSLSHLLPRLHNPSSFSLSSENVFSRSFLLLSSGPRGGCFLLKCSAPAQTLYSSCGHTAKWNVKIRLRVLLMILLFMLIPANWGIWGDCAIALLTNVLLVFHDTYSFESFLEKLLSLGFFQLEFNTLGIPRWYIYS